MCVCACVSVIVCVCLSGQNHGGAHKGTLEMVDPATNSEALIEKVKARMSVYASLFDLFLVGVYVCVCVWVCVGVWVWVCVCMCVGGSGWAGERRVLCGV